MNDRDSMPPGPGHTLPPSAAREPCEPPEGLGDPRPPRRPSGASQAPQSAVEHMGLWLWVNGKPEWVPFPRPRKP